MENNGLRFYQIFNFGGAIGVNSLSFGELIFANLASFVVILVILSLIATLFPIIMLIAYAVLLIAGNWEEMQLDRVRAIILSMVGYVYFMVDYHFGLIGWSFFHTFYGAEFVDKLCYFNTALFLFNIVLLLYGNSVLNQINSGFGRLALFILLCYLCNIMLRPMSENIAPMICKQYVPKVENEVNLEETKKVEETEELDGLDKQIEAFERGRGRSTYRPVVNYENGGC
jgi:hypothetical protein